MLLHFSISSLSTSTCWPQCHRKATATIKMSPTQSQTTLLPLHTISASAQEPKPPLPAAETTTAKKRKTCKLSMSLPMTYLLFSTITSPHFLLHLQFPHSPSSPLWLLHLTSISTPKLLIYTSFQGSWFHVENLANTMAQNRQARRVCPADPRHLHSLFSAHRRHHAGQGWGNQEWKSEWQDC